MRRWVCVCVGIVGVRIIASCAGKGGSWHGCCWKHLVVSPPSPHPDRLYDLEDRRADHHEDEQGDQLGRDGVAVVLPTLKKTICTIAFSVKLTRFDSTSDFNCTSSV